MTLKVVQSDEDTGHRSLIEEKGSVQTVSAAIPSGVRARFTPVLHALGDVLGWVVAIPLMTSLRWDLNPHLVLISGAPLGLTIAVIAQVLAGMALGIYRRKYRYGTFDEMAAIFAACLLAGVAVQIWDITVAPETFPRSVPVIATAFAINWAVSMRAIRRIFAQRRMRPLDADPIVVIGGGNTGAQVVEQLISRPDSPYIPVAILDDDPLKSRLVIQGVRVKGDLSSLPTVAKATGARVALLAIPGSTGAMKRRIAEAARAAGITLLVVPPSKQLFGRVSTADIRPIAPEDFLGRDQVEIDEAAVEAYVKGRRVLVTGAGGSIGSEIARQVAKWNPSDVIMLDRDESGLHSTQLSMMGHGLLDSPNIVLADIRDLGRMMEVFETFRPDIVFHAAALKHMPLLETHPAEAWKTNVVGTNNVLTAAKAVSVSHFVNISTDKAADAQNVLGGTKRITERLTAGYAEQSGKPWVSVRFGNVLGSRGSVLTSFQAQVDKGGPITVTHPHVTRYFMTIQEAVRLTIFAAAIGRSGEVLVLDMGAPVRILDVAERFARQANPPLEIVFTGLRPGEKLHEVLLGVNERDVRPIHPLISHVPVPPLSLGEIGSDEEAEMLQKFAW